MKERGVTVWSSDSQTNARYLPALTNQIPGFSVTDQWDCFKMVSSDIPFLWQSVDWVFVGWNFVAFVEAVQELCVLLVIVSSWQIARTWEISHLTYWVWKVCFNAWDGSGSRSTFCEHIHTKYQGNCTVSLLNTQSGVIMAELCH